MSAAMEDQIWREIGGLENGHGELDERLGKVERRLGEVHLLAAGRRTVAVALIDGVFRLASYGVAAWFFIQLLWWLGSRSHWPEITAYCI